MSNFNKIKELFTGIADSIRNKKGSLDDIPAKNLAEEISNIKTNPIVMAKTVTSNGIYVASEDSVDGYSSVEVSIPRITSLDLGGPTLKPSDFEYGAGNTIVTDLHTHIGGVPGPSSPSDPHGCIFDRETVTSCRITFNVSSKTITKNGTYDLLQESPQRLITKVNVAVPTPTNYTGSYTVTENGTVACSGKKMTSDLVVNVSNSPCVDVRVFPYDETNGALGISVSETEIEVVQELRPSLSHTPYPTKPFDTCINTIYGIFSSSTGAITKAIRITQPTPWENVVSIFYQDNFDTGLFTGTFTSVCDQIHGRFYISITDLQHVAGSCTVLPTTVFNALSEGVSQCLSTIITRTTSASHDTITFDENTKTLSIMRE